MLSRSWTYGIVLLGLTSCAIAPTPYHKYDGKEGYIDVKNHDGTFVTTFAANQVTPPDKVTDYVLVRAMENCLSVNPKSFPGFLSSQLGADVGVQGESVGSNVNFGGSGVVSNLGAQTGAIETRTTTLPKAVGHYRCVSTWRDPQVSVRDLDQSVVSRYLADGLGGIVVTAVQSGSINFKNLYKGDIILKVGEERVDSTTTFHEHLQDDTSRKWALIRRGGQVLVDVRAAEVKRQVPSGLVDYCSSGIHNHEGICRALKTVANAYKKP